MEPPIDPPYSEYVLCKKCDNDVHEDDYYHDKGMCDNCIEKVECHFCTDTAISTERDDDTGTTVDVCCNHKGYKYV